ncbi:Flavin-containing monooxygenase FMO GS-OX-like 1 [Bienertia sinuspersici]
MESVKVAVIGGGVSGLISTHELLKEGHRVTLFEKSDKLGGLWAYDPRVEPDPLSHELVHSSVYNSLRTNLPRALMGFSDFAFEERQYGDPRVFPGHQEVLAFLNDFAGRVGVFGSTRFKSEVVRVERVGGDQWVVEWRRVGEEVRRVSFEEEVFDAVVVCNGHCTIPRVAYVPGIEKWPGKQIHSHNYRVPEPFKDQIYTAKEDSTIEFEDGSSVKANTLLHCTGYNYEFPFLKTNNIVSVDDNRVGPLYKHVFPPKLAPWLSFVGLPQKVIIFEMMELQSKWIARVLSRKVALPPEEEMTADVQEYYQQMTLLKRPKHLTHYLINFEEYLDWLALQAGTSSLDWRKEMYKETVECVENGEDGYRDNPYFLRRIQNSSTILASKNQAANETVQEE